ncbi:unnamed protein product [Boreogadus saida]
MVANLKMRYKEESGEWLLLNKAALLDPRFSRLVHLSPAQKHLVTESLSHELTETETDTDRTRQGEKSAVTLGAMGSLFGDLYSTADRSSCSVLGLDLLNAIWFSNPATAAPNQRTEGVSENNDDKVVRQFELLL